MTQEMPTPVAVSALRDTADALEASLDLKRQIGHDAAITFTDAQAGLFVNLMRSMATNFERVQILSEATCRMQRDAAALINQTNAAQSEAQAMIDEAASARDRFNKAYDRMLVMGFTPVDLPEIP